MWNDIPDILKAGTALVAAITAALKLLRPKQGSVGLLSKIWRGTTGLISATLEREAYKQMAEHEKKWGHYWMIQAKECQQKLQETGVGVASIIHEDVLENSIGGGT